MRYNNNITSLNKNRKQNNKVFINIFTDFLSICLFVIIFMLVLNPSRYMQSVNDGILLFFVSVFPSLFPFFFISKILTELGTIERLSNLTKKFVEKVFRVPAITSYAFLMSIICGYPVGAKIIGDLHESNVISDTEAHHMIKLCTTSGPIFVIGSVGVKMLGDYKLGLLIFVSHITSSVISAFVLRPKKSKILKDEKVNILKNQNYCKPCLQAQLNKKTDLQQPQNTKNKNVDNILASSVNSSIMSILTVGAFVSIFFMFIDILYDLQILNFLKDGIEYILNLLKIDSACGKGIASGIVEMTRGINELGIVQNKILKLVFVSGLVSFGGFSIILQSLVFLSKTKIKTLKFIGFKCFQSFVTMLVSTILGLIFY